MADTRWRASGRAAGRPRRPAAWNRIGPRPRRGDGRDRVRGPAPHTIRALHGNRLVDTRAGRYNGFGPAGKGIAGKE